MTERAVWTVTVPAKRWAPVVAVRPARRRSSVPAAVCARCEGLFEPTRSDAKFCKGACRQAAYRRRRAKRGVAVVAPHVVRGGLTTAELAARNPHIGDVEQLDVMLAESAEMGIVEQLPSGGWALTLAALVDYGAALAAIGLGDAE